MTVRECYEQMNSDYEGVLERLGSEAMVKKFALRFLDDASFNNLTDALKENNAEEAFRAVHTLKGICLNLGFDRLYEASSALTEKLRNGDIDNTEDLYNKLKEQYDVTVNAIKGIQD